MIPDTRNEIRGDTYIQGVVISVSHDVNAAALLKYHGVIYSKTPWSFAGAVGDCFVPPNDALLLGIGNYYRFPCNAC